MATVMLAITACLFVVGAAVLDTTTVSVTAPANNSNVGQNDSFTFTYTVPYNSSFNTTGSAAGKVNCTVDNSNSANDWHTQVGVLNTSTYNVNANVTFTAGVTYNYTINCTNGTDQYVTLGRTFTVALGNPTVANHSVLEWLTGSTHVLNITASDVSGMNSSSVFYQIYANSTADGDSGWIAMSNAASGGANWYIATVDTTTYTDGWYLVSFKAKDIANNENVTSNYSIKIDNTAPSIVHTCDTESVWEDAQITCACSASDNIESSLSPGSVVYAAIPDTTQYGTYTTTCTATDSAGNSASNVFTYYVRRSSAGGGGGAGSGIATATTAATQAKTIASMEAGVSSKVSFDSADIAVKEIAITSSEAVSNVKVSIQSLSSKPADAPVPTGGVYQYLKIEATNIEDKLQSGEITFKVPKTWLNARYIDSDRIVLNHLEGNEWKQLVTKMTEDLNGELVYTATVSSFSYFVITGEEKLAMGEEPAPEPEQQEEPAPEPAPPKKSTYWYWIIAVIAIAAVAYFFFMKKKKK